MEKICPSCETKYEYVGQWKCYSCLCKDFLDGKCDKNGNYNFPNDGNRKKKRKK